jgi:hypothetical protein
MSFCQLPTIDQTTMNHRKLCATASKFEPLDVSENVSEGLSAKNSNKDDTPPVGEIRIPTPQLQDSPLLYSREDYVTSYYCCQQELFRKSVQLDLVLEENRRLKRLLIEMQRDLFHVSRSNRRKLSNNAWTIPPSNARRSISNTSSAAMVDIPSEPVPKSISAEESA